MYRPAIKIILAIFSCLVCIFFLCWFLLTQPVFAVASQPPSVDPSRLQKHVEALSETFYPRSFDTPEKMKQAAAYIEKEFQSAGGRVSLQKFLVDGEEYVNVIASFGFDESDEVVIGAHYDSYVNTTAVPTNKKGFDHHSHTPGADDNASGVAGLIELAYLIKSNPPKENVTLVAYALEDPPYFKTENMGSAFHVRSLLESGKKIKLMISLEMIGYFSDEVGSQRYPLPFLKWFYPETGNFIAVIGRFQDGSETRRVKSIMQGASDLPVYSINALREVQGVDFSDHLNYWDAGFPALMVTDTAFFRNNQYHLAGDVSRSLDYNRMAKVIESIHSVLNLP